MNVKALTLLTGLIWLGAATAAAPDPSVIEQAVETTTTSTPIPTPLGAIAARGCESCEGRYLTLTGESKFYFGRTLVSFADFKAVAAERRFMTIFFRAADNTVTRVVISAD
jgi:hypothetical protein